MAQTIGSHDEFACGKEPIEVLAEEPVEDVCAAWASDDKLKKLGVLEKQNIRLKGVVLLITILAIGFAIVGFVVLTTALNNDSTDGMNQQKPAIEVDVVVNDVSDGSHGIHTPIINRTFTEFAAADVGTRITFNIIVTGAGSSNPTSVSLPIIVTSKTTESEIAARSDAKENRLLIIQPMDEHNHSAALSIFGKNITSVSCIASGRDATVSQCMYHDGEEDLSKRRRLGVGQQIVVGVVSGVIANVAANEIERQRDDGGCFPGNAQVFTPDGPKMMKNLKTSDEVLTHAGYSPVSFFGHSDPHARAEMVNLETSFGMNLSLTAGHYVPFTNGTYAAAKRVRKGDAVWVKGMDDKMVQAVVTKIGTTFEVGLFNPYPHAGTIVVNGILASAHSAWLLEDLMLETHIPATYQILLTPVRVLHRLFPSWLERFAMKVAGSGSLDQRGVAGIAHAAMTTILK